MANFFAWLLAAVAPLAKQVLIALGIGTITYTGVDALLSALQNSISANFGQLTAEMSGLVAMTGFFDVIGILLGALSARAALAAVARLGLLT